MLLLSSVTLFIQESEVEYNLYIEDTGRYFFKPTIYKNRNIFPPTFWATRTGSGWHFEGIHDRAIKNQAIEEISYFLDYKTVESSIS
jgi:hypothetical protein